MFYVLNFFNINRQIPLFSKYGLMIADFIVDNISGMYLLIQAFEW